MRQRLLTWDVCEFYISFCRGAYWTNTFIEMQYPVVQYVYFSSTFHSSLSCGGKGKEKISRANVIHSRLAYICHPVNLNKNRWIAYYFLVIQGLIVWSWWLQLLKKSICCELENLATIFGSHMPALWPYISLLEDLCVFAYPYMGKLPGKYVWPELEAL